MYNILIVALIFLLSKEIYFYILSKTSRGHLFIFMFLNAVEKGIIGWGIIYPLATCIFQQAFFPDILLIVFSTKRYLDKRK